MKNQEPFDDMLWATQEAFTVPCPHCDGQGHIGAIGCGPDGCRSLIVQCDTCQGRGTLSEIQSIRLQAGSRLQRARRVRGAMTKARSSPAALASSAGRKGR